jgi:homoserine/homoserine lactone efflux protein
MNQYIIYILISSATIASPGPGVVLTLGNTINYGPRRAVPGIIGIASGMGVLAVLAAFSVGLLASRTPFILNIIKVCGAVYLTYLGVRLFMNNSEIKIEQEDVDPINARKRLGRFFQGFFVTLSNPKPVTFFMALFPQFIVLEASYISQFSLLAGTFCGLVILIHAIYSGAALLVKSKIEKGRVLDIINRAGGGVFISFAVVLLYSAIS